MNTLYYQSLTKYISNINFFIKKDTVSVVLHYLCSDEYKV